MRFLLAACAFTVLSTYCQAQKRPNVLFLLADDMRPDCIGALGNSVIKTPNLDKLVNRGFAMTNAYCMGSTRGAVCFPSRHQILSGYSLYRYRQTRKERTWGDAFNQAGYETWHISKRGNTAREYHKAFKHSSYLKDREERVGGHHGRTAANKAIEFINNGWDKKKPLCMYVGFAGPHDPRVAAEKWMKLYERSRIPLPKNFKPFHRINNGWMNGRDEKLAPWPRTEQNTRKQLHDYYACISSIDHHVGRILKALADEKQLENTIVIFSADHGLAMGSHGLFGKQNLYEHSAKSPLVFAGPGIPKGKSEAPCYLFDIFPTVADMCRVPVPNSMDGNSFAPVIRGQSKTHRKSIFLAYEKGQRAYREGDWKLYRFPLVNQSLLFNLKDDPHELSDLSKKQPDRVAGMLKKLADAQQYFGDPHPHTSKDPGKPFVDAEWFKTAPPVKRPRKKKPKKEKSR